MEARLLRFQLDVVEGEIINLIKGEAFPIIERLLIIAGSHQSRAFFLKIKADYKRYLAEIVKGQELSDTLEEAKILYEQAISECEYMHSTHPMRLAVSLNYSVFLAEQTQSLAMAVDVAKAAFEAGLYDLQSLSEDRMNDTLRVMQLLRDNYTLWEIDLKAIISKQKAAGHFIEGAEDNNNNDDDEEEEENEEDLGPVPQEVQDHRLKVSNQLMMS